jgi:AdoMet-dependent rRNA methyltransferase SPB1
MTKSKREKRKANEKKARTIQRLHLNMTAPEDMTMEDDLALAGEDVFDLGQGEKEIKRRGGKAKTLDAALRDADGMDESEHEDAEEEEEEEEFLDSEDEREARTAKLEGALDGLYENYQDRMRDRDAKWKVKQARLRDRNQDSWHGVNQGSDDEDERIVKVQGYNAEEEDASDVESEGGWDHVAAQKAKIGEEVDSSDEDSDSVHSDADEDAPKVRKVRLALPGRTLPAGSAAETASRKPNNSLVANLGADVQKAELSRAAQVWFDQSVFKGVGDLAELDGLDEEEEAQEVSDVEMEDQEVSSILLCAGCC